MSDTGGRYIMDLKTEVNALVRHYLTVSRAMADGGDIVGAEGLRRAALMMGQGAMDAADLGFLTMEETKGKIERGGGVS